MNHKHYFNLEIVHIYMFVSSFVNINSTICTGSISSKDAI